MSEFDRKRGLYTKFQVKRTDLSHRRGGKHTGCDYFVLDLTHDQFAAAALKAYADACYADYPILARDLYDKIAWIAACDAARQTDVGEKEKKR